MSGSRSRRTHSIPGADKFDLAYTYKALHNADQDTEGPAPRSDAPVRAQGVGYGRSERKQYTTDDLVVTRTVPTTMVTTAKTARRPPQCVKARMTNWKGEVECVYVAEVPSGRQDPIFLPANTPQKRGVHPMGVVRLPDFTHRG